MRPPDTTVVQVDETHVEVIVGSEALQLHAKLSPAHGNTELAQAAETNAKAYADDGHLLANVFQPTSQGSMLALPAKKGDLAIRTDQSTTYILATSDPTQFANWVPLASLGAGGGSQGSSSNWNNPVVYSGTRLLQVHKTPSGSQPTNGWPVMLLIHGGGPEQGAGKEAMYGVGDDLAAGGILGITLDYSSFVPPGPNAMFPVAVNDCVTAIESWIKNSTNVATYHMDTARIGAMGDSWGAAMAAYLGTWLGPSDPGRVKCWISCSGIHDYLKYVGDTGQYGNTAPSNQNKFAVYEHALGGPPALTATQGIAGSVNTGAHQYLVTFVDAFGETAMFTATSGAPLGPVGSITLPSGTWQVSLTNIPLGPNTGPSVTTGRNIYRNRGAGSVFRKLVALNATDTTYTDNATDASINAAVTPPTTGTSHLTDYASNIHKASSTSAPGYLANGELEAIPSL